MVDVSHSPVTDDVFMSNLAEEFGYANAYRDSWLSSMYKHLHTDELTLHIDADYTNGRLVIGDNMLVYVAHASPELPMAIHILYQLDGKYYKMATPLQSVSKALLVIRELVYCEVFQE